MIRNRLKELWAEGRPTLNGWMSFGNSLVSEVMAAQGYDSLTVDMQHGAIDYTQMLPMLQVMRASGVVPLVRVPWLEPGAIMKALDGGAYGIICPMISTADQAAEFVSYLRYPPRGQRSFGPTRVSFSAGANYGAEANDQIIGLAMIETAEGMENLEAIAATPGLDGLYVGPSDLTLGVTNGRLPAGFDREEEEMIVQLKRIAEVANANGIPAALHCGTPDYAARAIGWGYRMVTVSSDLRLMTGAAQTTIARFRELAGQAASRGERGAY